MIKTIKFYASEFGSKFIEYPKPASKFIPDWYKKTKRFLNNDTTAGLDPISLSKNTTIKACMPFRDAMTAGYIWGLPTDLEIRKTNGNYFVRWPVYESIIDEHPSKQYPLMPPPEIEVVNNVFKFVCDFYIKTPKNYSLLFTHPLNRTDLPFRSFSGIVETDKYDLPVNFPFQILANLEEGEILIIEQGTPVIQFVPIKRDKWIHQKLVESNPDRRQKASIVINKMIKNAYRNLFWVKKDWN
jgi:hypothetical protein